jgi:formylglycine-generating enzyme required for sulfatase activity
LPPKADLGRLTNLEFPNDDVMRRLAEETRRHTSEENDAAAAGVKPARAWLWGVAAVLVTGTLGAVLWPRDAQTPPEEKVSIPEITRPTTPARPDVATPQGMVAFKGGSFQMGRASYGSPSALDVPQRSVTVEPFALATAEVTTGDFKAFSDATGAATPWPSSLKMVERLASLPVVDLRPQEAEAFCRWRYGAQGRLPSEEEWEWAARQGTDRRYPSGNTLRRECINAFKGEAGILQPVGGRPCGATPEGIQDLAGNAAEWTSTTAALYPGATGTPPPADARVVRGGSFSTGDADGVTTTARQFVTGASRFVGFRCAASLGAN